MSNALLDDLDLENINPDQLEAKMASGGCIPAGLYRARLDGAKQFQSKQQGTDGWELEFTIVAGHFAGEVVKENVWITDNERGKGRRVMFLHRLGVLEPTETNGKKHYKHVEGKTTFIDVLHAECVINVEIEEYDMKDKDTNRPTGKKGHKNKLAFEGLFKLDDPKVAEAAKGMVQTAGAAAGTTASSNSKANGPGATKVPPKVKEDLGDL